MPVTHPVQSLTVGCFASICRGRLSDVLLEHAARHPATELGVVEMGRSGLISALRTGEIDLAIAPAGLADGFETLDLWREPVAAALRQGHRLDAQAVVRWRDLRGEVLLVSRKDYGLDLHRVLLGRVAHAAAPPSITVSELDRANLLKAVAEGRGVTLACDPGEGSSSAGVVWKRLDGLELRIVAIWRAHPDPGVSRLVCSMRGRFRSRN